MQVIDLFNAADVMFWKEACKTRGKIEKEKKIFSVKRASCYVGRLSYCTLHAYFDLKARQR